MVRTIDMDKVKSQKLYIKTEQGTVELTQRDNGEVMITLPGCDGFIHIDCHALFGDYIRASLWDGKEEDWKNMTVYQRG